MNHQETRELEIIEASNVRQKVREVIKLLGLEEYDTDKELGGDWNVHIRARSKADPEETYFFRSSKYEKWRIAARHSVCIRDIHEEPVRLRGGDPVDKVTVASSRSAAAIAKDLERRLLVHTRAYIKALRATKAEQDAYLTKRNDQLGEILGIETTEKQRREAVYSNPYSSVGSVRIQIYGDGDSHFELNWIKPDVARKLATVLREAGLITPEKEDE